PAWGDVAPGSTVTTEYRHGMPGSGVVTDPKPDGRTKVNAGYLDRNCDGIVDKVTSGDSGYMGTSTSLALKSSTAWTITPGMAYGTATNGVEKFIDWTLGPYPVTGPVAAIHVTLNEYTVGEGHSQTITQLIDVDGDGKLDLVESKGSTTWKVYYG